MRLIHQLKQMTLFHFRLMMRNKIAFFFNLVMPLLLLMVFGAMYGGSGSGGVTPIGLVDDDGGFAAQAIRYVLDGSKLYKVTTGEEEALLRQLDDGKVRAVLILPDGLSEQVARKAEPPEVLLRWDPSSSSSNAAQASLQYLVSGLDFGGQRRTPTLTVRAEKVEFANRMNIMDFMMPGMLAYMLLNAGVISVAITVAYHRKNGTMRHLFSTPLSMGVWLTGRILSNLVLSVVQILLVWIVGMAMFKVQAPSNLGGTAVILLFSTLASLALGLAIGALAKNGDAAQPIALIVSMTLSFLGNAMMPLDGAPQIVHTLMGFMPSYYMTHAMQRVMMKGHAVTTVLADLGVLATTTALFLSVAAWRLRKLFVVSA